MSFHEKEEGEELRGTYKLVVSAKAAKKPSFVWRLMMALGAWTGLGCGLDWEDE